MDFESTLYFLSTFFQIIAKISPILLLLVALILAAAVIVARTETMPFHQATYMCFITALTIGYGDFTPKRPLARFLAILLGIVGMIFTGIIVAVAVQATTYVLDLVQAG